MGGEESSVFCDIIVMVRQKITFAIDHSFSVGRAALYHGALTQVR